MSFPGQLSLPLGGDPYLPVNTAPVAGIQTPLTSDTIPVAPMVDPVTGDMVILGGQIQFVYGTAYIAQLIRGRLLLFLGEYVPDTTQGMPWMTQILVKGASPNVVRGYFSQMILGTPGVQSIKTLTLAFDYSHRKLSVTLVAQTNLGLLSAAYSLPLTPGAS